MKMKDLSRLSSVSHYGNKIGKEAIIARIKKVGFTGESYEEAIKYLKGFERDLRIQQKSFESIDEGKSPSLVKNFKERFSNWDKVEFEEEELKIEIIIDVLEGLKDLSSTDRLEFFVIPNYNSCENLRNFLFSNFDKVPLEVDDSAKKMQAEVLYHTAIQRDIEGLKFLLGLGVSPYLKHDDETVLEIIEWWDVEGSTNSYTEVLELLKAQRKPE
jgi:hypothetical protein